MGVRVAIVTGGTGGIGGSVVEKLLEKGASVVVTGRNQDKLDALAERVGRSDALRCVKADISVESEMEAVAALTTKEFGRLDVLIANAGVEGLVKPLLTLTSEEFATVQMTNIVGTFNSVKHAALVMSDGGAMVATGSVASIIGVPGLAAYSASKHAIAGLVKVAALELAAMKIRVNAVAPAPIDNEMMRSIERQVAPPEAIAQAQAGFAALNAMKRYGRNEEVANAILFLASPEASYITGAILSVDGGLVAA